MQRLPIVAIVNYLREEAEMYELGLSAHGLQSELIITGDADTAARRIIELKPNAVITRILPGQMGIALTTLLRAEPTTARLPIVVATSLMQPDLHEAARAAGASQVFLLPVAPEQIAASIKTALREIRTA